MQIQGELDLIRVSVEFELPGDYCTSFFHNIMNIHVLYIGDFTSLGGKLLMIQLSCNIILAYYTFSFEYLILLNGQDFNLYLHKYINIGT